MHRLDWTDLQYVLAVARAGSLAAAARELGVNHATVLRRVARFEEAQGAKVFDRHPGGYRLVADHTALLPELAAISDQVGAIARRINGSEDPYRGVVHLTTTDSLSTSVLAGPMAGLRAAFPDIAPVLTVTNERLDLARLDADIVIRPAPSLPDEFRGQRVAELAFRVYAAGPVDNPMGQDWIAPMGALDRSPVAEWLARTVPEDRIVLHANSFVTMTDMAEVGLGLAMIPCCLGDTRPRLVPVPGVGEDLSTGVWIAAHRDRAGIPRIKAVLEFLAGALAEARPLLGRL